MRKRVLLDVDGVVADLVSPTVKFINAICHASGWSVNKVEAVAVFYRGGVVSKTVDLAEEKHGRYQLAVERCAESIAHLKALLSVISASGYSTAEQQAVVREARAFVEAMP